MRFSLVFLLLAAASLAAGRPSADPTGPSSYDQAVHRYLKAATKELRAYHVEIAAAIARTRGLQKQRCEHALADWRQCDAALRRLQQASRSSFDVDKAEYERDRTRLAKTWQRVRPKAKD